MPSEAELLRRLKALEEKLAEVGKAEEARTPNVLTLDEKAAFAIAGIAPRNRAPLQYHEEYPKVLYSVWRPDGVEVKDEFHEAELRQEHGPWLESPAELPSELQQEYYAHSPGDPVLSIRERARRAKLTGQPAPQPWTEPGPIPAPQHATGEPSGAITRRPPGRPPKAVTQE